MFLITDLRRAAASFMRTPGFAAVAVLALALGIGVNTAIFTVVSGVLLRPLPYPEPERLVAIYERVPDNPRLAVAPPSIADWAGNRAFSSWAVTAGDSLVLLGRGEPERLEATAVSGDFFQTLQVAPERGRWLEPRDDQAGAEPVVVLGHALWKRSFGGDPSIVGRQVTLTDKSYTVAGVMPPGFAFPGETEAWVALQLPADQLLDDNRYSHYLAGVGRLAPGVGIEKASASLNAIAARVGARFGDGYAGRGVNLVPLRADLVGDVRPALLLLLVAVGFVLIIACVNVANLLLARSAERDREVAIRAALGASQLRLASHFAAEGLVLTIAGGLAGLLLAAWARDAILWLVPADLPRLDEVSLDWRVFAFAASTAIVTGLLLGLAPAVFARRRAHASRLASRGTAGSRERARVQSALMIAEVALSLILLLGAGLLANTFWRLTAVDPGFKAADVLTFEVMLPPPAYPAAEARARFQEDVLARLARLPGARRAGAATNLPLSGTNMAFAFFYPGERMETAKPHPANYRAVSPGYLEAIGVPLVAGRWLAESDRADRAPVVVVNQAFARRYFPGRQAIGERISITRGRDLVWREIVGIVGDLRHRALSADADPEMYVPFQDDPVFFMRFALNAANAESLAGSARAAVWEVDRNLPVTKMRPLEALVAASVAQPRFHALLVGGFALLALVLAAIGLYGVVARLVAQRTQEIGVRSALGASPRQILALVGGHVSRLVLAGLLIGLAGALALTRTLERFLFGVQPTDVSTFAAVTAIFALVAGVAAWLPARRALRVDPVEALRAE